MNEEDYNIFTQKNNVNLNNEIDSLSFKDINLRDGFIKISETTPFIYQKLGLKNLPVHVYIQKLARALFLEKESYGERRTHGHKNEFSIKEMKSVFENISNPRYIFNSKQNFYDSEKLTLIGVYDEFDKYENPMIITICFDKNRYSTEVNWVTSIYGKNKDVIINDWTEKGYLLYKNDVEIKKASEEVVTLYMRISKSSNAYKNNILLKSQLVNENTNASIENDNGEFLYDASHSTIEKGLFLESIKKIPEVLNQINRLEYFGSSDGTPSAYYDKRLINICQVPQMPYLEKINGKWLPTKEAVKAVKAGNLYIQKSGQEYKIVDLYFSLTKEDISYIYSEEFISKFGDWEKANRLEKFRLTGSIKKDEKIILNGSDITSTVESLIENEDRKELQALEKEIGKTILGKYQNDDTGIFVNVSNRNVTEISNHHYLFKEHIQSLAYIPKIIEKATFIAEVENEDKKKHPNIEKYLYFGTGLNLSGEEYTCKSVIGVDSSKNCYYDQSLSTIAKGKLIDYILQNKKSGNLSPLITQRETGLEGNEMPYVYYDKRLINICQVPQMPYLELITNGCQRKKLSRL